jgi:hypothetical protein
MKQIFMIGLIKLTFNLITKSSDKGLLDSFLH